MAIMSCTSHKQFDSILVLRRKDDPKHLHQYYFYININQLQFEISVTIFIRIGFQIRDERVNRF